MKFLNLFLVAAFLLLHSKVSYSQKVNIGIGYNIGTHVKTTGLDFVIGRYNNTRSYLTTKMESPGFFRGMNYSLDMYYLKYLMSFEWTGRKSDVWARGV